MLVGMSGGTQSSGVSLRKSAANIHQAVPVVLKWPTVARVLTHR